MRDNPEGMQLLKVGNCWIEYSTRGEGEAVFLVHAGVFSDWFRPLSGSPTLSGFKVIRVRRAGYGKDVPVNHLSIADHARHVGALAATLGISTLHWVGHSSSCQIGLQLALERPELVQSLILMEPAPGGTFGVPASEALGRDFIGPALAAFGAGDVQTAFETFMNGVCGDKYRQIIEAQLGKDGYRQAVRESAFFFRDEIEAVMEWHLSAAEAARVTQPVLNLEGGQQPAHLGPLSNEVTQLTVRLLPQTQVMVMPGLNHGMPLQDPDSLGRVIANYINTQVAGSRV